MAFDVQKPFVGERQVLEIQAEAGTAQSETTLHPPPGGDFDEHTELTQTWPVVEHCAVVEQEAPEGERQTFTGQVEPGIAQSNTSFRSQMPPAEALGRHLEEMQLSDEETHWLLSEQRALVGDMQVLEMQNDPATTQSPSSSQNSPGFFFVEQVLEMQLWVVMAQSLLATQSPPLGDRHLLMGQEAPMMEQSFTASVGSHEPPGPEGGRHVEAMQTWLETKQSVLRMHLPLAGERHSSSTHWDPSTAQSPPSFSSQSFPGFDLTWQVLAMQDSELDVH